MSKPRTRIVVPSDRWSAISMRMLGCRLSHGSAVKIPDGRTRITLSGAFRNSRDVRLESVMRTAIDARQRQWIYEFTRSLIRDLRADTERSEMARPQARCVSCVLSQSMRAYFF